MAVRTAAPVRPKVPEIRKGDTVVVLAGKDVGKRVRICGHCGEQLGAKP